LKIHILNVDFDNITESFLLQNLKKGVVVTPNVDHLVKMQSDETFYKIVKESKYVVCDSKVIYLLSKLTKNSLESAIPGSSFFTHYYEFHRNDADCKIFILGAKDGVAEQARQKINAKIGREIVIGAYSPTFGFEKKEVECSMIHEIINKSGANVVLVGVGAPKQEKWISQHKVFMPNVKIWMALGATIDFEAGNIRRAPKIFQKLALEWLFRMCCDPHRLIKRYLKDDLVFFWLFLKQLLGIYKNPFENK
jgi:N-acetylglucosaminyldiphosphoundecaprenol N-acetyl-beta-D-mannosaminyltransferase